MSPFFEVKHYTREEVEELLRISMTDELNIFHNRNKIITNKEQENQNKHNKNVR